ncbi:MAG: hypothetical protein U0P30_03310 [Vicinamibacterales bacterium]
MSFAILAHRGNTTGPDRRAENSLPAIGRALRLGWGLEIDIRRAPDGRFYVAHDPVGFASAAPADGVCALLRAHPRALVALNIKELGDEAALIDYLDTQGVLPQCCLFDMELLEATPGATALAFRALHPTVALAARVSDRGESIAQALAIDVAQTIWLDEFDGPWATRDDVDRLKAAGRRVWMVSPDLHGATLQATRRRWREVLTWGLDGICTDYAEALEHDIETQFRRVTA